MQGKKPMKILSMNTTSSNIVTAPLLLPGFLLSLFFFLQRIYRSFNISGIIWLLLFLQRKLLSSLLFFLSLLPSLFTFILHLLDPSSPSTSFNNNPYSSSPHPTSSETDDSGLARTLAQLLFIVTDIPVSSRKYDLIRSLAERLIDDNHIVGFEILRDLNRRVLSAAFSRTLARLQAAAGVQGSVKRPPSSVRGAAVWGLVWAMEKGRWVAEAAARRMGLGERAEQSPEKLAAELLWMAEKMASCGTVEEAMCRWAGASGLASYSLAADPRLQGALVRISAFLMKEAKGVVEGGGVGEEEVEERREMVTGLLVGWLPLMCHASNGKDEPVLSVGEKGRVEAAVMEVVAMLRMEQQERVLSLWIHNFTYASSSDWPDLRPAYARWCAASRKLVILR